ncbi:hypothetical protein [Piscinibacter sp.]|uniref:hypothetical protein n=1 Tax=Piscinibacter sp. TaxID=1903157 RepID=UPI002C095E41|nr:hypothetical protein [Albitalea sp.]HUG25004.1 hypothetical protein [Albitalea sp.]
MQQHGFAALPRLDDHRVGPLEDDALARFEHVVVGVAALRQPHAPAPDGQLAG